MLCVCVCVCVCVCASVRVCVRVCVCVMCLVCLLGPSLGVLGPLAHLLMGTVEMAGRGDSRSPLPFPFTFHRFFAVQGCLAVAVFVFLCVELGVVFGHVRDYLDALVHRALRNVSHDGALPLGARAASGATPPPRVHHRRSGFMWSCSHPSALALLPPPALPAAPTLR